MMLPFDFERPCPSCGRESSRVRWAARVDDKPPSFSARKAPDRSHPRYLECEPCGILYASPAIRPEAALAAYRETPFVAAEESKMAAASYAEAMERLVLPRLRHRGLLVDIGAGNGTFLDRAAGWGFSERIGLEVSERAIDAAGAEIKPLLKTSLAFPQEISVLTAFQVLEHIADPLGFLKEAFAKLRPGGVLLVVSHDWRALLPRMMGERSPLLDVQHYQLFSRPALAKLAREVGFTVETGRFANAYPLSYWAKLAGVKRRLPGWRLKLFAGNFYFVGRKRALPSDH